MFREILRLIAELRPAWSGQTLRGNGVANSASRALMAGDRRR